MSQISAAGLNHYTVVNGLDSRKLRESVVGHRSVQWRSMEDCFRDICASGAGHERAKDYGRVEFDALQASPIN